jgi:hypothetical protein
MKTGRPPTIRPKVQEIMVRGAPMTIPEICAMLGLHYKRGHCSVRRALLALGARQVGKVNPRVDGVRGGSKKPVFLWSLE